MKKKNIYIISVLKGGANKVFYIKKILIISVSNDEAGEVVYAARIEA